MEMTMEMLEAKLREARFACVELQLYCDTHPDDEMAQADYLCYAEKLMSLQEAYERAYGPFLNFGQSPTDTGSWVYGKWPWENGRCNG